jgi:hypothetical protein
MNMMNMMNMMKKSLWIIFLKKYIMYLTGMREMNHESNDAA